jgi:hypothetical protein
MFLSVLVTCVTLEGQAMCHEFGYTWGKSKISRVKLRKSVGL